MSSKTGDRSRTLISFKVPGGPKKACHIQRSCEATASKTIVGFPDPRAYCPFQAAGLGLGIRGPNRVSVLSNRVSVFRFYQNQPHSDYIKIRFGTGSVLSGSDRG